MNNIEKIIADYGRILEQLPQEEVLHPISLLPYSKEVIEEALLLAIKRTSNAQMKNALEIGLISLKNFIKDETIPDNYLDQLKLLSNLNK